MALLWEHHEHNSKVTTWQSGAELAVCPLTEIGFLRISTQPVFGASVAEARRMLKDWKEARKPKFVPCDIGVLEADAPSRGTLTTDFYLASLAHKHGMQLATLDEGIGHHAAFLIA